MAYDDLVDMEPDELRQRIIELEQQLAELNDIETEWKKMLARAGDLRLALDVAETKLTERDKLLDECEKEVESAINALKARESYDYTGYEEEQGDRLITKLENRLTKLRDRKNAYKEGKQCKYPYCNCKSTGGFDKRNCEAYKEGK